METREWSLVELAETDSTNNHARRMPDETDCPLVVVTADYQTAGRGAGTNTWESERGQNLLFSLVTHPRFLPAPEMFLLSEILSLAICDALDGFLGQGATRIKWPNDIYVGDRKLVGMLIENELCGKRIDRSIMGVGINVNQTLFRSPAPNPVSLAQLLGRPLDRRAVLGAVIDRFLYYYNGMEHTGTSVHEQYLLRLYRFGELHPYRDVQGEFLATLETVEPTGHLRLRDTTGHLRRSAFKEVQFIL